MRSIIFTFILLIVLSVAAAEPQDIQPGAKFTVPGVVVVTQCNNIVSVVFTDDAGRVSRFQLKDITLESLKLMINRAETNVVIDFPCNGGVL